MNYNSNPHNLDPFSMLDSEVHHDINSIPSCQTCGSVDVEIDIGSNKVKCKNPECADNKEFKESGKKSVESINAEKIEQEQEEIDKALKQGATFVQRPQAGQTGPSLV